MLTATVRLGAYLKTMNVTPTGISEIGSGDDGVILRIGNEKYPDGEYKALKVFKSPAADDGGEYAKHMRRLMHDQATRELKALKLIGSSHPNFLRVYSDEVDTCEVVFKTVTHTGCLAIQINYISQLNQTKALIPTLGLLHDNTTNENKMEFNHRNILLKHIQKQYFDILYTLHANGIVHRDLDSVNVMLRLYDLQVFVFDFARASFNSDSTLQDTEQIAHDAKCKIHAIDQELMTYSRIEDHDNAQQNLKIQKKIYKSYRNPIPERFYEYDTIDDALALRLSLRSDIVRHIATNATWSQPAQTVEVGIEDSLISSLVERNWTPPLSAFTLNIDALSLTGALDAYSKNTIPYLRLYEERTYTNDTVKDQKMAEPRTIVHSQEYHEHLRPSHKPCTIITCSQFAHSPAGRRLRRAGSLGGKKKPT